MWRGRRKGDGSIGKVIGDKEGGIVGMLADSLVPIHPVFSIRPSFSCPTKFTTRFSFLTIAPLPFFCGILGKISMHDGPSIAASFLPPRHYRGGTNVPGSESFARDSSRRQVFTLFRWFSFHVYRRCREFFFVSLVLFTILLWDSSLFFCGLIFLSGIRERKIVRGKKWRMKYRIFWKWNVFDRRSKLIVWQRKLGNCTFFESFEL